MNKPPTWTPWGQLQDSTKLSDGIYFVSTARHGGVWLDSERRKLVPDGMIAGNFLRSRTWWEEDCDTAKILAFFKNSSIGPCSTCETQNEEVTYGFPS